MNISAPFIRRPVATTLITVGIAFAGALMGALYPAWMAARKDPIDALAYE